MPCYAAWLERKTWGRRQAAPREDWQPVFLCPHRHPRFDYQGKAGFRTFIGVKWPAAAPSRGPRPSGSCYALARCYRCGGSAGFTPASQFSAPMGRHLT